MRCLVFFWTMALLAWPGLAVLAADPPSIEAFVGDWKGREAPSTAGALSSEALSLEVQRDFDGFRLSWLDLGTSESGNVGGGAMKARFSPTDRAGVYEFAPEPGSLLTRMFASPATGNPLKGETLLWARIDGQTLAVYSMRIDLSGGFDLDHYSWTRTEDGLHLTFSKRTEEIAAEIKWEGELVTKRD